MFGLETYARKCIVCGMKFWIGFNNEICSASCRMRLKPKCRCCGKRH